MSKSFDLKKEIDKYTSKISYDIFSPKKRNEIKQEYADHIEDEVYQLQLLGMNEKEAFYKACENMGDESKTRFLLAEIHNNKLQRFIVNKIRHLKSYFTSKRFFKTLLISSIVFFVTLIFYISHFSEIMDFAVRLVTFGDSPEFKQRIFTFIFVASLISILILILKSIIPVINYCIGRSICYIRLASFCLFHRCKFSIARIPFASFRGLNESGDIKIAVDGQIYIIHFIDVIMKYRREVTILNDGFYTVSKVLPDQLHAYGATLIDGESWYNLYVTSIKNHTWDGKRTKKLPNIATDNKDSHILIINPTPIAKSLVRKNGIETMKDGDTIANFTNYSFKGFIRLLKRIK